MRLHQEGLTEIMQFANNFQQKMEEITNKAGAGKDRIADAGPPLATIDEGDEEEEGNETKKEADEAEKAPNRLSRSVSKKTVPVVDSIKVKLVAQMEQVAIELISEKRPITNLKVQSARNGKISGANIAFSLFILFSDSRPQCWCYYEIIIH